jgi:putative peptidoglycan lipid II flippase
MRGAFTFKDALESAYALQMYGISLWAVGYARIQTQALYAMQKAKVVVNISWLSLSVNIVFCIILMPFLKHAGIALASSISVFVQLVVQHKYLMKTGIHVPKEHLRQFTKMTAAAVIMGIVLIPIARVYLWKNGLTLHSGALMILCVVFGGALYFLLLWLMGMRGLTIKSRPS